MFLYTTERRLRSSMIFLVRRSNALHVETGKGEEKAGSGRGQTITIEAKHIDLIDLIDSTGGPLGKIRARSVLVVEPPLICKIEQLIQYFEGAREGFGAARIRSWSWAIGVLRNDNAL